MLRTAAGCCELVDPGMEAGDAEVLAERFKALSDPARVRICNLLARNGELCVCELQAHLGLAQGTVSHHLALLRRAELVSSETRGRWAFYRINPEALSGLGRVLEVSP